MLKGDSAKPLYYRVRIAAVGGVHFMPQVISSPRAGPGGGKSVVATEKLEFELLRACCAAALSTNHDERIPELISLGVRWDVLLEQAEFHNVEPLVCAKLLEFRVSLPANLEGDLERRFATNAQRSLRLTRELARITACLENHSVDAIPYKGPALAQAIYGDVAMRQFSDLDILIRVSEYDRAAEAVRELGYEPAARLRAPVERAWLKTGYERGFDGPQGKNLLELQWRAAPGFYAVDIDVVDWFRRATCSSLGERKVRALSPEDLLLALCVHASKHAWMRLGWICDIGGVTQSQRIDYDVVRERAAVLGILRIIEVSLEMAHRLLGRAVPLQLEPKAVGGVQDLCDRVTRIVARGTDYETESLEYFRLMLALRERASDRWRFGWRLLSTPSVGEWEAVTLPGALFPLYRVVRLWRVGMRLAS